MPCGQMHILIVKWAAFYSSIYFQRRMMRGPPPVPPDLKFSQHRFHLSRLVLVQILEIQLPGRPARPWRAHFRLASIQRGGWSYFLFFVSGVEDVFSVLIRITPAGLNF